ncbi:hypothetical protein GQF24_11190, partial [Neisseria meningitidis]|nr:hypothetical protein [Neisseria meningitidis]
MTWCRFPYGWIRHSRQYRNLEIRHSRAGGNRREGAARDIVLLNTAAALYAGNVAASLSDGISA